MTHIPTIKDVAQAVGVHFTTVSMALRGHPRIPVATRERIIQEADRLGYRRNPAFTALSQRRTKVEANFQVPRIAYIANRSEKNGLFETAHHRRFAEGAQKQAEALGYHFELQYLDEGAHTATSLQQYLREQHIGGVILGAFESGRGELQLEWSELCAVKIDTLHMPPALAYVANDQYHAVSSSLRQLRQLGYSRIGLAVGLQDEESSDDQHLSAIMFDQLEMPESERIPPLLFPHAATHREALPMLDEWIRVQGLDAVISNWTSIRSLIESLGYACPRQVACASICLSRKNPRIAGIIANMGLVGERAVSLLAELMRSDRRGIPLQATRTLVKGTWQDGSSAPRKKV